MLTHFTSHAPSLSQLQAASPTLLTDGPACAALFLKRWQPAACMHHQHAKCKCSPSPRRRSRARARRCQSTRCRRGCQQQRPPLLAYLPATCNPVRRPGGQRRQRWLLQVRWVLAMEQQGVRRGHQHQGLVQTSALSHSQPQASAPKTLPHSALIPGLTCLSHQLIGPPPPPPLPHSRVVQEEPVHGIKEGVVELSEVVLPPQLALGGHSIVPAATHRRGLDRASWRAAGPTSDLTHRVRTSL